MLIIGLLFGVPGLLGQCLVEWPSLLVVMDFLTALLVGSSSILGASAFLTTSVAPASSQ